MGSRCFNLSCCMNHQRGRCNRQEEGNHQLQPTVYSLSSRQAQLLIMQYQLFRQLLPTRLFSDTPTKEVAPPKLNTCNTALGLQATHSPHMQTHRTNCPHSQNPHSQAPGCHSKCAKLRCSAATPESRVHTSARGLGHHLATGAVMSILCSNRTKSISSVGRSKLQLIWGASPLCRILFLLSSQHKSKSPVSGVVLAR